MKSLSIFFLASACLLTISISLPNSAYAIEVNNEAGTNTPALETPAQPAPQQPSVPAPQVETPAPMPQQPSTPQAPASRPAPAPQRRHPGPGQTPSASAQPNASTDGSIDQSADQAADAEATTDTTPVEDTAAQNTEQEQLQLLSAEDKERSKEIAESELKHFKSQWLPIALASGFICLGFIIVALAKRQYNKRRK